MGGYLALVAGLGVWNGAHLLKRVAPDWRARQGDWVKGLVALALVASIWVMSRGYGAADPVVFWGRWEPLVHLNNLLNLVAVFLFVASNAGGWVQARMRHPQLTAVKIWAVAHLLVNGSLAALLAVRGPAGLGRGRGRAPQPPDRVGALGAARELVLARRRGAPDRAGGLRRHHLRPHLARAVALRRRLIAWARPARPAPSRTSGSAR